MGDITEYKGHLSTLMKSGDFPLPSNVKPEAFRNAAIVAVQDNPAILNCDTSSVMKSIRTLAAAGLVPDGREGAIVPFNGRAQAMPMVFGLMKMARRSGDVKDLRAHIVYQKELDDGLFKYVLGDEEALVHTPILFGEKGEAVAVYAVATLKDGTKVREFMDKEQVEKVRKSSPQQRSKPNPVGIWQQWSEEMWKKTAIRRICKRLDMSSEDLRRVMVEEDTDPIKDVTPKTGFADMAQQARKGQEPEPTTDNNDIADAEIIPEDDWTLDTLDLTQANHVSDEYQEGMDCAIAGQPVQICPHTDDKTKCIDFVAGWNHGKKQAEEEAKQEADDADDSSET